MSNLSQFQQFGLGAEVSSNRPNGCVIYTRVSTKEQADNNYSLETQLKGCESLMQRGGYDLVESFGGTGESAKSGTARKEFQRMMTFIRRNKKRVGHLIVYSPDRFVRDTEQGAATLKELRNMGIRLHSVLQDVDDRTSSGHFQRLLQFAFSEYDNINRRDKCMAGTLTRLEKGGFCSTAPFGYENITRGGEKTIVPSEDAKYVRAAFEMKAYERLAADEIITRLRSMGCQTLYRQHLHKMYGNPTYCGLLRHKFLGGRVLSGNHEPIVSRELFLMANELMAQNARGWKQDPVNNHVPLKGFLKCEKCGKPITGYLVKRKGLYYYKCNTKGCKVNRSARKMNEDFREIINCFQLDERYREPAKKLLIHTFQEAEKEKRDRLEMLRKNRQVIERKLERLEERFIDEEIDQAMWVKHSTRFRQSIIGIDNEIEKARGNLSNPQEIAAYATEIATNLAKMWDSGGYAQRQRVQEMVFPEGISYNRENDNYRTFRINTIFDVFSDFSPNIEQKRNGQLTEFGKLSAVVPPLGPGSNFLGRDMAIAEEIFQEFSDHK